MSLPLAGVRVLDLTRLLPGPFCTLLLRRLGAEVIKLEPLRGGDWVRYLPPHVEGRSAVFDAVNAGKRGLALDLKHAEGPGVVRRMIHGFDVVAEGFRPGVLDRLGIGWETLSAERPSLVWCALTGFGQDGPLAQRAGHDLTYAALGGVLGRNGDAGGPPRPFGLQVADLGGAFTAALGVVAALYESRATGRGRYVDASLTEGALSLGLVAQAMTLAGQPAGRGEDDLDGGKASYRVYTTADGGHFAVAPLEPQFWQAFCEAVERPDLLPRQHLAAGPGEALEQELRALFATRTRAEWEETFSDADACVEPVLDVEELVDHPHHAARGTFLRDGERIQTVVGPRFLGEPPELLSPSPGQGEHSIEVLEEAGFERREIERLLEAGVVAVA